MASETVEVRFILEDVPELIPEERLLAAQEKAKEAFVMELLRQAEVSAGRAAEILKIDRWHLSYLMSEYNISLFDHTMTLEELQQEVNSVLEILEKYKQ